MSKEVIAFLRSQSCESRPKSSLSFLYQTRTLSTLFTPRLCPGRAAACRHYTASSCLKADHIPFERPAGDHESLGPNDHYNPALGSRNTITASERVIFDRIFNEVRSLRPASKDEVRPEDKVKRNDFEKRLKALIKTPASRPSIPSVREHKVSLREKKTLAKPRDDLPLHFTPTPYERRAKKSSPTAAGLRPGGLTERTTKSLLNNEPLEVPKQDLPPPSMMETKVEQYVQEARERNMKRITTALRKAPDDAAVWDVLEKQVFPRAALMTQDFDRELLEAKKVSKGLRSRVSAREKLVARLKFDESRSSQDMSETPSESFRDASSEAAKARKPPKVSPLTILQTNYAPQLLYAMRLLRAYAPTSPYVPLIIKRIRAIGPASYVLGATTELYNEALFLRWRYHLDWHGVGDLVHEMLDQGIGASADTLHILNAGARWRHAAERGEHGPVAKAVLQTADWEAGWRRWVEGFRRAKANVQDRLEDGKVAEQAARVKKRWRRKLVEEGFARQRVETVERQEADKRRAMREKGWRAYEWKESEEHELKRMRAFEEAELRRRLMREIEARVSREDWEGGAAAAAVAVAEDEVAGTEDGGYERAVDGTGTGPNRPDLLWEGKGLEEATTRDGKREAARREREMQVRRERAGRQFLDMVE